MKMAGPILATFALLSAAPAVSHKIVEPGPREKIAKSGFSATPETEWNRLQQKGGKYQEIWTIDGDQLNEITFYGGVPVGEPIFKERDKKNNPLPRVTANMLITDIPVLLESTYRTALGVPKIALGSQDTIELDGLQAIKFAYTFVDPSDEVERSGEGIGAFVRGKLYLVTFEAPSLYFFDRDVDKFRQIAGTIKIRR